MSKSKSLVLDHDMNSKPVYTPLNPVKHEIRLVYLQLVHLQPYTAGPYKVNRTLVTVSLDEQPSYEALSYEWGKSGLPMISIEVDQA